MGKEWSPERKLAASEAYEKRSKASKSADATSRIRIGAGDKRDVLSLPKCPEGYKQRVVNDIGGRVANLKERGYAMAEGSMQLGTSHVDGNNSNAGVVSRDVGKGVTAYVMLQKLEYYNEDKADKQKLVDDSEEAMRRKKVNSNESADGNYGEVKIG